MERKKSAGPAVIFQLENIVIFCSSSIETSEITHSFIVVFQDESALDRHLFLLAKRPKAWETQETETKAGYESRQPIKVHVRIKEKEKQSNFRRNQSAIVLVHCVQPGLATQPKGLVRRFRIRDTFTFNFRT